MDANNTITDCNRCNQCHHSEVPKRSQEEPLKRNKEGHGNQPQSHKEALPTNGTRALWGRCEYHNNTHYATIIIITGATIAATQARRMQEGDNLRGKPQADRANSCPRSPMMNMGSTTIHTRKELTSKKKCLHFTYTTRHARQSLDNPQTESLGRASDTIPSDDRTSTSNDIKNYHCVSI